MNSWRSTADDPPALSDNGWRLESDWVLVYEAGDMMVAKLTADDDPDFPYRQWVEFGRDAYTCTPSHWQPLPEAPHA